MHRSLTAREKNLITAAVTVIFCSLFVVYLIVPAWHDYSAARSRAEKMAVKQEGTEAAGSQDIRTVKRELDDLRRQLPEKADTAELLYYLNKAAQESGVALAGFSCEPSTAGKTGTAAGDLKSLYGKVTVLGTYAQIRDFIGKTESLPRITHNRVVSINESKDIPNRLEGQLEFDTFAAGYGDKGYKNESDIPRAATGKETLFRY